MVGSVEEYYTTGKVHGSAQEDGDNSLFTDEASKQ